MPEGPSLLIAAEELSTALGKRVRAVSGNSTQPIETLKTQQLLEIGTHGKHLLLFFSNATLKIHFLMFGSYRVNEPKGNRTPRLALDFAKVQFYFYACSLQFLEGDANDLYDWREDVLSPAWDEDLALQKISALPNEMICDILMNQHIFAGVGNIIKNEVQFRMLLPPQKNVKELSQALRIKLIRITHDYCWNFYYWKKQFQLKKHWQIMRKKVCPRCNGPVTRKVTGYLKRLSHYCKRCQK